MIIYLCVSLLCHVSLRLIFSSINLELCVCYMLNWFMQSYPITVYAYFFTLSCKDIIVCLCLLVTCHLIDKPPSFFFLNKGHCYGCTNNGSAGLKHPNNSYAYLGGHVNAPYSPSEWRLWWQCMMIYFLASILIFCYFVVNHIVFSPLLGGRGG